LLAVSMPALGHAQDATGAPGKLGDRITCSIAAAVKFSVPANLVLAVAETEGGRPGQWVVNRNGSYDVGSMQFNTAYLRELARYGITAADVAAVGCYAYELATWRLARHLARDGGDIWQRAANYHSRTPKYNAKYRAKLMARGARWASWLKARYATREFERPAAPAELPPMAAGASHRARAITPAEPRRRGGRVENRRRMAAQPRAASRPVHGQWVKNSDVHLSVDELRALDGAVAGP
jgi:hypothetical protein